MSNKAKNWQAGTYTISVFDNSVVVSHLARENGSFAVAEAKCVPEDEFDLVEGVTIAMQRLEQKIKPTIVEGDTVKIKNRGKMYSRYHEWVSKQVANGLNPDYAARYRYDVIEPESVCKYKIIKIAPHLIIPDYKLAMIESVTPEQYCYVIDVKGLEKC